MDGAKVSIYNQSTHPKFPLLGLKFKNSTKLHLMQGPITVFDGTSYAGDARILDLQPKEERLISYAIDLGTEVEPINVEPKDDIIQIKVIRGIVEATHKVAPGQDLQGQEPLRARPRPAHRASLSLRLRSRRTRQVHERARDVYRFEVKVASGEKAELPVVEEKDVRQTVSLSNSDDGTIRFFLSHKVSSDKVRKALDEVLALKAKVNAVTDDIRQNERRLEDIRKDQQRHPREPQDRPAG